MMTGTTRRQFLQTGTVFGATLGLTSLAEFLPIAPTCEADANVSTEIVRFDADIEASVRLIEDTPREKCIDVLVEQLRAGLPYNRFEAALLLAGIRNVPSRSPGADFHSVLGVHSCYDLARTVPPEQRLRPMLFALDAFKSSPFDSREFKRKTVADTPAS